MSNQVLGIGYSTDSIDDVRNVWAKKNLEFDFAFSMDEAILLLKHKEYICIAICTDSISNGQQELLRSIRPIPIVYLSPAKNAAKRAEQIQQGVVSFIMESNKLQKNDLIEKELLQYYFDQPDVIEKPLTIFSFIDLFFCLEHRIVRVRDRNIDLTPKEFSALHYLISNHQRVLTYEAIYTHVWGYDACGILNKSVNNLIGRLRRKLKIADDVPEYIQNVHSIGYKFSPHS